MDKIFRSSWFIKVISFLIALMLYNVVSSNAQISNDDGSLFMKSGATRQSVTENLTVRYDEDKYVVTGVPETVNLLLEGSIEQITKAKFMTTKEVYIDLSGKKPGTYKVKVMYSGFPSGLKVTPDPQSINVTIQKKVKKKFPVTIDYIHKEDMQEGYKAGDPKIMPELVTVIGAEDFVNRIAFVKGFVDLKGAEDVLKTRMTLNAYDEDGNQLNVTINPAIANVELPIISPSKDVPVSVKTTGTLPDGKAIASIDIDPKTVTVYGKKAVLSTIDKISDIELPLGDIGKSQTIELTVPIPKGAEKVEPNKISVKVTLNEDVKRTLQDVPIAVNMPADQNKRVTFVDPPTRTINVDLIGAKSILDKIQQSDIKLSIDVSNAAAGEDVHLPIQVKGPDNVTIRLERETVTVRIDQS
ncbi:MAG: YbbR-like domain-containing protein [Tuberibacillus sp.]